MYAPNLSGCSDHNCLFQRKDSGIGTNGGCRCEKALMRSEEGRNAVKTIRYLRKRLAKQIAVSGGAKTTLREAAKQLRLNKALAHATLCDYFGDQIESVEEDIL